MALPKVGQGPKTGEYGVDAFRTTTKRRDRKSTRLNSSPQSNLVCRLLLEKKKRTTLMQLFGDQHVGDHVEAATAVCLGHHGDRRQSHLSGLLQHRQATLLGIVMSVGQRPYSTC